MFFLLFLLDNWIEGFGSGSGSMSLSNGSGCWSGRPKIWWILQIWRRIRILNTGADLSYLSKCMLLFRLPEDFICTAYTCAVSNRDWRQQSCDVEADPAVSSWKVGAHCEAIWPANGRWHPAKEWRVCLQTYIGCFLIWRYKFLTLVKSTTVSIQIIVPSGVPVQLLQCCGAVSCRHNFCYIYLNPDPYT